MVALWLITMAAAGTPFELPAATPSPPWEEPLALAGLTLAQSEHPPWVRVQDQGAWWSLTAMDADGHLRLARVPAPVTQEDREDLAWLAASLVLPLEGRLSALHASLEVPEAAVPPPAAPAPAPAPATPRPVVVAPFWDQPDQIRWEFMAPPSAAQDAPLWMEPGLRYGEPLAPVPPSAAEGRPARLRLELIPRGELGGAGPGGGLGGEVGLALGAWGSVGLGGAAMVPRTLTLGGLDRDVRTWEIHTIWWRGLPPAGLAAGLGAAASHRRFPGAAAGEDQGWVPVGIAALRWDLALGPDLLLAPRLELRADARSVEVHQGELGGTLPPLWVAAGLGLAWRAGAR